MSSSYLTRIPKKTKTPKEASIRIQSSHLLLAKNLYKGTNILSIKTYSKTALRLRHNSSPFRTEAFRRTSPSSPDGSSDKSTVTCG